MLLASTSSPSFARVIRLWKAPAVCTSLAAARACRPSRLTISVSRSIIPGSFPLELRRLAFRTAAGRRGAVLVRQLARQPDAALPLGLQPAGDLGDAALLAPLAGETQDHRQVDAGQDLDRPRPLEGERHVAGRAAKHVGEDEHPLALVQPPDGGGD